MSRINLNGIEYISADEVADSMPVAPPRELGRRSVIFTDRWIFAGDVYRENGRIRLDMVVWVSGWDEIGLDGMLANPHHEKVRLKPMPGWVEIPAENERMCIPVDDHWGL